MAFSRSIRAALWTWDFPPQRKGAGVANSGANAAPARAHQTQSHHDDGKPLNQIDRQRRGWPNSRAVPQTATQRPMVPPQLRRWLPMRKAWQDSRTSIYPLGMIKTSRPVGSFLISTLNFDGAQFTGCRRPDMYRGSQGQETPWILRERKWLLAFLLELIPALK